MLMFSNFIQSLQRVTLVLLVLAISIVLFVLYQPTVALGNTQLPEPDVNQVRCSADGTSATLSWDPVREGDTYALRLDDFTGNNSSCADGWYCGTGADVLDDSYGQTSYTARNLTPGTTYEWWVHRKNYNTWDGISDWTKRTFSCAADGGTEEVSSDTVSSIDMADYLNSSALPANKGIAVLAGEYPHQAKATELADGTRVVFTGKNFGTEHENYDVLVVNEDTVSIHYEVSESNDYVRRFIYEDVTDFQYEHPSIESGGSLWTPRYPELGKPYMGSHQIEYYEVDTKDEPLFRGSKSPKITDMVVWVDRIETDVVIPAAGYRNDHLIQLNQQWHKCVVEQYTYAENIGLVKWQPIYNIGCLNLQRGQTYDVFGDVTGGITYKGIKNGNHIFTDGNNNVLQTVRNSDFHNNGAESIYVHARPDTDKKYYSDVVAVNNDWSLTPAFLGRHVDDLPYQYDFTPIEDNATVQKAESKPEEDVQLQSPLKKYSWITTNSNLNVRSQASTNSAVVGVVPEGTSGIIFGGPVYADGYTWWDVYYLNGTRGYSVENWLAPRTFGNVKGVQTTASWEDNLVEKLRQLQYTLGRFLSTL